MMQDRLTRLVEAKSASHELGSPQNPLIGTYNPMSFKRWDSDLLVSLCERDDGYEINVIPIRSGPTRHYRIAPDGSWTDLAQPAPSAEKVLREALEKLARLGNEPDYGNSTAT